MEAAKVAVLSTHTHTQTNKQTQTQTQTQTHMHTLAFKPLVKRKVFSARDRLTMVKQKALATTIVTVVLYMQLDSTCLQCKLILDFHR